MRWQVLARCNKVLDLPYGHSKAHFRRAKAYTQLGRLQVPPPPPPLHTQIFASSCIHC